MNTEQDQVKPEIADEDGQGGGQTSVGTKIDQTRDKPVEPPPSKG